MSFSVLVRETLREKRQIQIDVERLRPEFAAFRRIGARAGEAVAPFEVAAGEVTLGEAAFEEPALLGFYLRHGLELAWLRSKPGVAPNLAGLAAARAAAVFMQGELDGLDASARSAVPNWVAAMRGEVAPGVGVLTKVSATLCGGPADGREIALIRELWSALGTAESLMETGGDIRLQRDPRSALNGYGCSHRPRPWAITFASSTASSSSERGYVAADVERLKTTAAMLKAGRRGPVARSLAVVRGRLAAAFGLAAGSAVVLAASGTDTELLALAMTHLAPDMGPILNILIAPEETGRGVPMAVRGVHFAVDTALGHDVAFEAPIAGFRADTTVVNVLLRDAAGGLRAAACVEDEIEAAVAGGIAAGRRVILHALDLSKTGLLAPGPGFLRRLRALYGGRFDIVVDACQARLSPGSVRAYLALDAVVLITGSKFFTGPPFAGAALIPPGIARRLEVAALPAGLEAYFGRDEFPAGCRAALVLPAVGNYGLALRWHAAVAELRALKAVPLSRRSEILRGFGEVVRTAVAADANLVLLAAPGIARGEHDEEWERLQSIFTFALRAPHAPGRCLNPVEARAVYGWLNADVSAVLGDGNPVARRICHIGQPVRLPQLGGDGVMGVLRVSAGARLISGEPSHRGLGHSLRIERELADLRLVFEKIDLLLRNWEVLWVANPQPRYRVRSVKRVTKKI
jgi:hypothetical protein